MDLEIKEKIDILLQVGKLLLQYGSDTEVVEIAIKRMAKNMGYPTIEVLILPYTIFITLKDGERFYTKLERAEKQEVNFSIIDDIETMTRNITKETDLKEILARLKDDTNLGTKYSQNLKMLLTGVGCASFSHLFGGDLYIVCITFFASILGFIINSALLKRLFNPFLVIVSVSFCTTIFAGVLTLNNDTSHIAISSSILFLVPSLAFINSFSDLLKRHYTNGIARGIRGIMISFAISIGMFLALNILGIERFL